MGEVERWNSLWKDITNIYALVTDVVLLKPLILFSCCAFNVAFFKKNGKVCIIWLKNHNSYGLGICDVLSKQIFDITNICAQTSCAQ